MKKNKHFEKAVQIRLKEEDLEKLEKCITELKDEFGLTKYQSQSHFLRCAMIRLLTKEGYYGVKKVNRLGNEVNQNERR